MTATPIKAVFDFEGISVRLDKLLPTRTAGEKLKQSAKYRALLASDRWQRLAAAGAHPQRLLWASTGTKDPALPDTFYIQALAAELTVNTMPEGTLIAFGAHGNVAGLLPVDGGDAEAVLASFVRSGIDLDALAARLQVEGADSFVRSWEDLVTVIASKASQLSKPFWTR